MEKALERKKLQKTKKAAVRGKSTSGEIGGRLIKPNCKRRKGQFTYTLQLPNRNDRKKNCKAEKKNRNTRK